MELVTEDPPLGLALAPSGIRVRAGVDETLHHAAPVPCVTLCLEERTVHRCDVWVDQLLCSDEQATHRVDPRPEVLVAPIRRGLLEPPVERPPVGDPVETAGHHH